MIIKVRENLELRTLVPGNADEVFEVIDKNREHIRQWLPWVDGYTLHNAKESIARWKKSREEKSDFTVGIFLGGNYIGNMGLHDINSHTNSAGIGYWLSPEWQGNGIMTDCVRALTNFGFDELDLNRIYIAAAFGNAKSRAVPERLGFVQEGILQDCLKYHGVYHDKVIYGVVKRNWRAR